mgnify:CR=1 FL=1
MMDFTPLTAADRTEPYVPPQTLRDRGWRQMKKNRLALWGPVSYTHLTLPTICSV